jgi:flagellar motor switch protein FliN/FliY
MSNPNEIESVLSEAQVAVEKLAQDVAALTPPPAGAYQPRRTAASEVRDQPDDRIRRILKLPVCVAVRLAERTLPVRAVMKLAPGTLLEFDRPVDQDLDLMVHQRAIGNGVAVKVGERFGLRVTRIGDARHRLESAVQD